MWHGKAGCEVEFESRREQGMQVRTPTCETVIVTSLRPTSMASTPPAGPAPIFSPSPSNLEEQQRDASFHRLYEYDPSMLHAPLFTACTSTARPGSTPLFSLLVRA